MGITNENWWKSHIRFLISIVITSVLVSVILLICLISGINKKTNGICLSHECVKTAGVIIDKIDFEVDPCENFYNFSCGNFLKNSYRSSNNRIISVAITQQLKSLLEVPIRDDEPRHFKMVKNAYKACMNEENEVDNMKQVKELLESLGNWPVLSLNDSWNEDKFDWLNVQYRLREIGLNHNMFFEVSVDIDAKNTSKYLISIGHPSFELKSEYRQISFEAKEIQDYYNYMVDIAVLFGAERNVSKEQLKESLLLEIALGNVSISEAEASNVSNTYNIMKLNELQAAYPEIPWLDYLNKLMSSDVVLTEQEDIQITDPKYLKEFFELLKKTPKKVLANYVLWKQVNTLVDYLSDEFQKKKIKLAGILDGVEVNNIGCVSDVQSSFPELVGALYVRKYFDELSKRGVAEIANYVKETFKENIKQLDWMDEKTRENALVKIERMPYIIGYPKELLSDDILADYYKGLDIDEIQSINSLLNITKFAYDFTYNKLKKSVNSTYWINLQSVTEVNAYYYIPLNSFFLPASILQGSYYNKNRPYYINFAGLGSTIGHELTHSFDNQGSQYDENGNLNNWWEPTTKEAFLNKTQCIIQQYNNYRIPQLNISIDGFNTQGENIADNGGIKQAYLAYMKWVSEHGEEDGLPGLQYTPKQIFWIYAAQQWCINYAAKSLENVVKTDEHSPHEFRVVGPFSNQKQFAEDFKCPKGSRMNPEKKCSVW